MNPRPQLRPVLPAERRHLAAVLVEHEEPSARRPAASPAGSPGRTCPGRRRPAPTRRVQRLVETAERARAYVSGSTMFAPAPKLPAPPGYSRIIDGDRAVADAIETATKTAAALEDDLRLRLELHRQDLAGERRQRRGFAAHASHTAPPAIPHPRRRRRPGRQELAPCASRIARLRAEIQPRLRLEDVAHVRPACARSRVRLSEGALSTTSTSIGRRPAAAARQLRPQRFEETLHPSGRSLVQIAIVSDGMTSGALRFSSSRTASATIRAPHSARSGVPARRRVRRPSP